MLKCANSGRSIAATATVVLAASGRLPAGAGNRGATANDIKYEESVHHS